MSKEQTKNEQPELDTERPHITIGYKKDSDDEIVTKCEKGTPDQFEVAAMLTHAQALNTLPLINEARELKRAFVSQRVDDMKKMKQAERKGKNPKKKSSRSKQ